MVRGAPDFYRTIDYATQRVGVITERDWQVKQGLDKVWSSYATGSTDSVGAILLKSYAVPSGKTLYQTDMALWTDTSGRYVIKRVIDTTVEEIWHIYVAAGSTIVISWSVPLRFDGGETCELYYYGPALTTVTVCYVIMAWEV